MKIKKIIKYWLPPVIWAIIIFLLSSRILPRTSDIYWQDFVFKKSSHIFFYAIHAVLLFRAFKGFGFSGKKAVLWAAITAICYGIFDEFHQSFVPGREPKVRDVGFDVLGVLLALCLIKTLLSKVPDSIKYWARRLELI